jgi:hypothetical protein
MGVIIMRPADTPLLARTIKRVRKGVYDIVLYHPSGRKYGEERVTATNKQDALRRCRLIYPSTILAPSRHKRAVDIHGADRIIYTLPRNSGE